VNTRHLPIVRHQLGQDEAGRPAKTYYVYDPARADELAKHRQTIARRIAISLTILLVIPLLVHLLLGFGLVIFVAPATLVAWAFLDGERMFAPPAHLLMVGPDPTLGRCAERDRFPFAGPEHQALWTLCQAVATRNQGRGRLAPVRVVQLGLSQGELQRAAQAHQEAAYQVERATRLAYEALGVAQAGGVLRCAAATATQDVLDLLAELDEPSATSRATPALSITSVGHGTTRQIQVSPADGA